MMNRRDALKNTALLGGSAAISTSLLGLLQSCQSQDRLSWTPQLFSAEQAKLVSALVDTILPKTGTPGGLDMKVDMFIDLFYAKILDAEGQKGILAAMDQFNADCKAQQGKSFQDLSLSQKQEFLKAEEAKNAKLPRGIWGYAVEKTEPAGFYRNFKSMAVMGYCTSAEIGKNQLKYDPVPGPYQGCIPLEDVGGVWSL
ncbi:MAG TPA: gluconate 2-dehydrogenase subunit 3 family protein [Saprospiraceae bacterium]|nr:gluconate 2-dehydrogenase subunit 3 family protein [Saprospiraceae bacterium]